MLFASERASEAHKGNLCVSACRMTARSCSQTAHVAAMNHGMARSEVAIFLGASEGIAREGAALGAEGEQPKVMMDLREARIEG